jgi:hypothetical protein
MADEMNALFATEAKIAFLRGGTVMLKYLRIAVTALSLTACLLAIVLWVRSYESSDRVIGPLPWSHMFQAYTWRGTGQVIVSGPAYRLDLWEYYSSPVPQQTGNSDMTRPSPAFWGFNIRKLSGVLIVTAPMWFIVVLFGAIPLALCRSHIKRRFSLRTLLIATTIVSAVLGIVVASSGSS